MRRAALIAALVGALMVAAPLAFTLDISEEESLAMAPASSYDYDYDSASAPAPAQSEEEEEEPAPAEDSSSDEEEEAGAPAPGPSTDDAYLDDYTDDKLGKWAVRTKRSPPSASSDDCPQWDEPAEGSEYPFYLGLGDAAYQIEGAAMKDKRGPSIWDTFSKWSGLVEDNANGDVTADFYGKYKDDIKLMKKMGYRTFRFSISWSRVLPKGNGTVNEKGLDFYSKLVDELLKNCIEPHVTLYHWDLPFELQKAYKGWIDYKVTDDFADYAEVVFKKLGDRVKHWTTFASPHQFCMLGYGWGSHAPGRCADCPGGGDVSTEPFMCGRNVVVAHAKAAERFREHVKDGKLGINLNIDWSEPWDARNGTHIKANERHLDLSVRMFADPLYKGRFPKNLREEVPVVPKLTEREVALLKKAKPDFFGLAHYTSVFIKDDPFSPPPMKYQQLYESKNGTEFGKVAGTDWQVIYPHGLRRVLNWIAEEYDDPEIIILENGVSVPGEADRPYPDVLNDEFRMDYFEDYLAAVRAAVREDDVQVLGFYAWKFLDGFEWADGYSQRWGVTWVNFTNLERKPKNSAFWLARKFNVLPEDQDYQKVLFIPKEEEQKREEEIQRKREQEKRKAMGKNAPVQLDDLAEAMPPELAQADPAENPFEGGR